MDTYLSILNPVIFFYFLAEAANTEQLFRK